MELSFLKFVPIDWLVKILPVLIEFSLNEFSEFSESWLNPKWYGYQE